MYCHNNLKAEPLNNFFVIFIRDIVKMYIVQSLILDNISKHKPNDFDHSLSAALCEEDQNKGGENYGDTFFEYFCR